MNKRIAMFIAIIMLVSICLVPIQVTASTIDVTKNVEFLGTPFTKPAYARNVWDMQSFNGKIYLGHGNSSNFAPSANAGTNGVIYFDPNSNKFVAEYTGYRDAQIDKYKILDGNLYIPGHDGESWSLGNFYNIQNNSWTKHMTIPDGIHVYDIESFGGNLFAVLGTDSKKLIMTSADGGATWSPIDETVLASYYAKKPVGRVYTLFKLRDKLYACTTLSYGSSNVVSIMVQITKSLVNGKYVFTSTVVDAKNMVPNAVKYAEYKMYRTINFNNNLLYLVGTQENDHQYNPYALYYATSLNCTTKITLPSANAVPIDFIVRDKTAYVLAFVKESDVLYTNIVYATTDGKNYTEVFRFTQDSFARSFEEMNGDFYFGLGCNNVNVSESTGKILRVNALAYSRNYTCSIIASDIKETSAILNWGLDHINQDGITYELYRNGELLASTDKTTFADNDLQPDKKYAYQVNVFDIEKNKISTSLAFELATLPDTVAPTTPENITFSQVTETSMNIAWNKATDNVKIDRYEIYNGKDMIATTTNTEYNLTGLIPGTTYNISVIAVDTSMNISTGNTSEITTLNMIEPEASNTADLVTDPVASMEVNQQELSLDNAKIMNEVLVAPEQSIDFERPSSTNLTNTSVTETSLTLIWDASKDNIGIKFYEVYLDGVKKSTTTKTSITYYGLIPGKCYSYTIFAYDAAGNKSDSSNTLIVTTLPDISAPSVPQNVVSSGITETSFTLSWDSSTDNIKMKNYEVYLDGVKKYTTSKLSVTLSGLIPGKNYTYTIFANDIAGNKSEASNPITITTLSDLVAPSVPKNLVSTGITETSLILTWDASTDNVKVKNYEIYLDGVKKSTTTKNSMTYSGLIPGKCYTYSVIAYDIVGNKSDISIPLQVTTIADLTAPTIPGNLTYTMTTPTSVTLNWNASSDNVKIKNYEIYLNGIKKSTTSNTQITYVGLVAGKSYKYTVVAYDIVGNKSGFSNELQVVPN